MTTGVDERWVLRIGAEHGEHIRCDWAEPSPRIGSWRGREAGTNLFRRGADFFQPDRCGARIEANVFHRGAADREIPARHDVTVGSVGDVAEWRSRVRHELPTRRLDGPGGARPGGSCRPCTGGDDDAPTGECSAGFSLSRTRVSHRIDRYRGGANSGDSITIHA